MTRPVAEIEEDLEVAFESAKKLMGELGAATGSGFLKAAPRLAPEQLQNCKLLPNRHAILAEMPKGGIVAEVGTQRGFFAKAILETCKPERLELIDLNFDLFQRDLFEPSDLESKIGVNAGDSSKLLLSFPEHHFDWIYIDADHRYAGVKKDIQAAKSRVKEGGLLLFNDYTMFSAREMLPYGVPRAIHEFCNSEGWEFVYLGLSGVGYHDVAIRKLA